MNFKQKGMLTTKLYCFSNLTTKHRFFSYFNFNLVTSWFLMSKLSNISFAKTVKPDCTVIRPSYHLSVILNNPAMIFLDNAGGCTSYVPHNFLNYCIRPDSSGGTQHWIEQNSHDWNSCLLYFINPSLFPLIPNDFYHLFDISTRQIYHSNGVFNSNRPGPDVDMKPEIHNKNEMDARNVKFYRKWIPASRKELQYDSSKSIRFKILCYNVLAQYLLDAHPHLYKKHDQQSLDWNNRLQRLKEEITSFQCEILCFQEIEEQHLSLYTEFLYNLGYEGIYKRRTADKQDGCAIFYRSDIFVLKDHSFVEYKQDGVWILNRDNIGIVAKLYARTNPSREIVVATTHLLYNPRRHDIRLAQVQILLSEIERLAFVNYTGLNVVEYLPIIITGDFNSELNSLALELLLESKVNVKDFLPSKVVPPTLGITDNCQHISLITNRQTSLENSKSDEEKLANTSKQEDNKLPIHGGPLYNHNLSYNEYKNLFSSGVLRHNFIFNNVYDSPIDYAGGTTFQDKWVIVDYILYSGKKISGKTLDDTLRLIQKLSLPKKDYLKDITIPNEFIGSDHLPLAAEFILIS